jgi:hypothetical protein
MTLSGEWLHVSHMVEGGLSSSTRLQDLPTSCTNFDPAGGGTPLISTVATNPTHGSTTNASFLE